MSKEKAGPSISKSALLLSGCLAWANPRAKWYDEKHTDTSARDLGTEFHRQIDNFIKDSLTGCDEPKAQGNGGQEPNEAPSER